MSEQNALTVVGTETKHVVYGNGEQNDIVFIKENIHFSDGSYKPNVRFIENYKRPFWVAQPNFRKYTQKKEGEDLKKLKEFNCRQRDLVYSIGKAIGRPGFKGSLKQVCESPYVYGADVTPPVLLKYENRKQYPNLASATSLAVLDIETDVVHGTNDINSVALTFKDRAIITATAKFVDTHHEVQSDFFKCLDEQLGDLIRKRNLKVEFVVCPTPGACVAKVMERAHEWRPDIIGIWNIDFDMPRCIKALERDGYDVGDVFTDPSVPTEYRKAKYHEGQKQKMTAEGKIMSKHPAECWHTVKCLASFQFIDLMSTYCLIRIAKGKSPSYALDYILKKHLGIRKLKFAAVANLENTLQWHIQMQSKYKMEYLVYNLFDCIGCELLDERIKDIAFTLPTLNGISEYVTFSSQPRRTCDNLHFEYIEKHNQVFGTTASSMEDELNKFVINMENHIVTLPAHQIVNNGIPVFIELPELRSFIRIELYDLDCVSTYPTTEIVANISKATTFMELCKVQGISETTMRAIGVNLTGGAVNALEVCHDVYGFPLIDTLLDDYRTTLH